MDYIIKTEELTKKYKKSKAVDKVNINILKGEIYGFLGKNGAGKTTTLRMLTGLIKPTSGNVRLFGEKLNNKNFELYERIGAIIEFPGFYGNLTVGETLKMHNYLMGYRDKKTVQDIIDQVGIGSMQNRKVREISLGTKQRLGIAGALIHKPELLILDEPLNGLDPQGIKEIRKLIKYLSNEHGITIVISSHILSEIQQLATTIGIISEGKLIEELSTREINQRSRKFIELEVDQKVQTCKILEDKLQIFHYKVMEEGTIRIYEKLDDIALINKTLSKHNINITHSSIYESSLEDYFIEKTGSEFHV